MRILSLVTNGHSMFYRQQATGLRERGHVVDTVAVPGRSKSGTRSRLTYAGYYPRAVAAAAGDYDVVHANYGLTGPPAVLQPFHPVVLSLWGSDLLGEYDWVARGCARFAEEVVVMSAEMAGLVDRPCHVIPHGIDLDLFRPIPQDEAREAVGWNGESKQVLFPYDPSRELKDFPRAERVVDLVRESYDGRIELQSLGSVDHDRIPLYMNAADAMLLTSKHEGAPNTVKEALACDLPVIGTDVGDLRERLDGIDGCAVSDDDDELAAALRATLASNERANGRPAVADLALSRQLDRIERVFRSAMDGDA